MRDLSPKIEPGQMWRHEWIIATCYPSTEITTHVIVQVEEVLKSEKYGHVVAYRRFISAKDTPSRWDNGELKLRTIAGLRRYLTMRKFKLVDERTSE